MEKEADCANGDESANETANARTQGTGSFARHMDTRG